MAEIRLLGSLASADPGVTDLGDGELDTLALGQRDLGLGALTDNENVADTGSERSAGNVGELEDVEASSVAGAVGDGSTATHVATTGDHGNVSDLELDGVDNLVLDKVKLDGVVDLDVGVGVTDGAAIVGNDVGDTLGTELSTLDLAELEVGLLGRDAVDGETALDVVKETEVLARLLNGDNV